MCSYLIQNCLKKSIDLFESVWNHRSLKSVSVILFLNKQRELKAKIEAGTRLEEHFPEFETYSLASELTMSNAHVY